MVLCTLFPFLQPGFSVVFFKYIDLGKINEPFPLFPVRNARTDCKKYLTSRNINNPQTAGNFIQHLRLQVFTEVPPGLRVQ
jgi:hypothetical protein